MTEENGLLAIVEKEHSLTHTPAGGGGAPHALRALTGTNKQILFGPKAAAKSAYVRFLCV